MRLLRKRLLRLSAAVTVHPYWATVEVGQVVDARMALKHALEAAQVEAA